VDRGVAIVLTLMAGALVAMQPPANASLARHVGNLEATLVSLLISVLIISAMLAFSGGFGGLGGITEFRPEHALGGIAGAAIVFVSIVAVKPLGAGGVAAATVATQLIGSAILDRFGVLDLEKVGLSATRVTGIALLVIGTLMVTSR
jgi:transporter family-2 protein